MHFNVSQLVRETSGSTREHEVEDYVTFRGDLIEVRGSVLFVRTDKGVWVTALLNTQVESEWGRCLDPYVQSVEITVDEEAIPRRDPVKGVRFLDNLDPEENLVIDEDNILDLTETARQYISLGLPMRPLCNTDCAASAQPAASTATTSPALATAFSETAMGHPLGRPAAHRNNEPE